jgi:hypothetical protein
MTLHEPATLVTDCLLAALAAWLAWRLRGAMPPFNLPAQWWSRALAWTAVSALVGGTYHGFAANLPAPVADAWWRLTLVTIGLVSASMDLSLMHECAAAARRKAWRGVIALKLGIFLAAFLAYPKFGAAILDYGITMLAWAACAVVSRRPWLWPMLAAIGLSLAAALVQQLRWSPWVILNHNDLYHVIQAFALVGFYLAGRHFGNEAARESAGAGIGRAP